MTATADNVLVAPKSGGLSVWDGMANEEGGFLPTFGLAQGIDTDGTMASVADESGGLRIFDLADPSAPVSRGQLNPPGLELDVAVDGNTARQFHAKSR